MNPQDPSLGTSPLEAGHPPSTNATELPAIGLDRDPSHGDQGGVLEVGAALKGITMSIALQLNRRLADYGITHAECSPLCELSETPGQAAADLARVLNLSPSSITRAVDRLEEKQLITRVRSSEDRRVVRLSLTPEGLRTAAAVPSIFGKVVDLHLAGLQPEERSSLRNLLLRMRRNGESPGGAGQLEGSSTGE